MTHVVVTHRTPKKMGGVFGKGQTTCLDDDDDDDNNNNNNNNTNNLVLKWLSSGK
jgi:hypothetical protein